MKPLVALMAVVISLFVPLGRASWTVTDGEDRLAILIGDEHADACGSALTRVAQHDHLDRWRSEDMIERGYFSHTILGTSDRVFAYFAAYGIRDWVAGGENIVWNDDPPASSADTAFRQLMASEGHREIIRNCAMTAFGVGACRSEDGRTMYTTTFSRQADGRLVVAAASPGGDPLSASPPIPEPLVPPSCSSTTSTHVAEEATAPLPAWALPARGTAVTADRAGEERHRPRTV